MTPESLEHSAPEPDSELFAAHVCYGVQVSATPAAAPGRPRRNEALSELRRKEIVAAAIKIFGKKGFEATRADEIAAAARIAKGTLYLYFKNKEAIYTAAVTHAVRELQAEVARRSADAQGFRDRLATAIRVRLEFWPERESIYRLLLTVGREPKLRRQTNEVLRNAHSSFIAIFEDGVSAGEIAPADFVPLAWAALDLVRGATERRMDKVTTSSPRDDAAWITESVLARLHLIGQKADTVSA